MSTKKLQILDSLIPSPDTTLSASGSPADAKATGDAINNLNTKIDTNLSSAKSYTDKEITEWVGDKTVSSQISTAIASKADALHTHGADDFNVSFPLGSLNGGTVEELLMSADEQIGYLNTHKNSAANPHSVTLSQLGVTATASELNKMDGVTATTAELNYVDGVTSNIQTQLDGKAASSHGTHVSYSTTAPVMDGTASVGTASTVSRSDHKHPTDTSRAAQTSLDSHTSNTTSHITSTERTNWDTAYTHSQAAHAPSSAEKNQNAFSNVKVGSTTIAADTTTDTLTLAAGSNITITPDATNDKVTIAATDTVYTHPTSSGNKHIPSGGSSGQILRWSADGTAAWGADNNTTYTLGSFGITASATELNYTDGVTSNIQTQLNGKAASSHGNHVPTTETANNAKFLRNDNTWQTVTPANIGAAASSHGTHVSYSSTAPVMDGSASVGSASTVARSDHKHPTDTSRAAQTDLTSHTGNKSNPHGVTAAQAGAVPTSRTVNGKALSSNITLSASDVGAAPAYTYGTTDMTAGSSTLATGTLYFVYE